MKAFAANYLADELGPNFKDVESDMLEGKLNKDK